MVVAAAAFLERVNHERARFQIDLRAGFGRAGIKHLFQFLAAAADPAVVRLIARFVLPGSVR